MPLTNLLKNTLALSTICAVFYFSSAGCKKTVVEKMTYDTTIVKDTTIIVDSTLDKTEILTLWQGSGDDAEDTGTIYKTLFKFNKSDYLGVDSIVFSANPAVEDTTGSSIVSLYDFTDSVAIAGSSLSSNQYLYPNPGVSSPGTKFLQTGNLYNALPSKEIILGATIKGTKLAVPGPAFAFATCGYLYLYRK